MEHEGNVVSSDSPGQLLRNFWRSERPLELLQNPSTAREATEHPTRGCKSVPCSSYILLSIAGLSLH